MKSRPWPYPAQVGILFGLYFLTAKFGLGMDPVSGLATPVWPPTGISLVALFLFGYRLWPGIALAAFLVNASVRHNPLLSAGGMAAGNTLEAVLGAYLLRRADFRPSLDRIRDVLTLAIFAAMLSTLVSPTIGVTSGWLGGTIPHGQTGKTWWTWWVGDMMGDLVLAALLFTWSAPLRMRVPPRRTVEPGTLLLSVVATSLLVFGDRFSARIPYSTYIFFPFLIWAALRFGPRGAVTTTFVICAIAIWGTDHALGPFARHSLSESLVALETFMGVAAITVMVLAADVSERRRAEEALQEARADLEQRVRDRTAELVRLNTELAAEISERRRADESLRKSERLLAEAQQVARLGSWEWDIVHDSITWSAEMCRIFGLEPGAVDLTYEGYLQHIHPEDRALGKSIIERSYQDHQPFQFDHRIVRPDGSVRWVHGQGTVILDDTGQPVRMLGTGQDITGRKRVEEELRRARDEMEIRVRERTADLEEADRAKDRFLAMLAHELRNPLAAIGNAVQLLKLWGSAEPRATRAQEIIERQVNQQAHLLDDLLNVSRIARGKIELQCQPLDLPQLIRETVVDYRSLLEEAGLTLELSLPEEPVWVEADPTRLAQVLGNLIQNAAKFTNRGGTVGVQAFRSGTREAGGYPRSGWSVQAAKVKFSDDFVDPEHLNTEHLNTHVAVTVRDTGIGIEPELLSHLFEPFTQADRTLDRSQGGLGLGLALVKGLVELHGGQVRAESEGAGRGAAFTVLLPTIAPLPAGEDAPARAAASVGHRRILIVEDNPDAAETLRDLLEFAGCTVQVAYSGPEAVSLAPQFQPEVVLCDLGLPGMDGFQVAAALLRDPVTAHARLIAVSGYGQEEDQARSRAAGFERHLTKPVDLEELQRVLELTPERRPV